MNLFDGKLVSLNRGRTTRRPRSAAAITHEPPAPVANAAPFAPNVINNCNEINTELFITMTPTPTNLHNIPSAQLPGKIVLFKRFNCESRG